MLRSRFALLLGASLALTTPVLAQPASDSDRALAVGHDALDLYNKGSWTEARAKFEEAERLAHSPVFVLYAARCARNAGDLEGARALYQRVAKETLPDTAPPPWAGAVTSAKEELAALEKRIAEASPAPTASASVPVPTASVSVPVPTASVSVPVPTASVNVPVPTASVNVPVPTASVNVPVPTASVSGSAVAPWATASGSSGESPSPQGSLVPGFVTLGVGLAAVGAGIGLFAHAKSIADGILARCGDAPCPASELPNRAMAYDFAKGSTAAFVGGGVLLAAGVTLLIWRPFGKPSPGGQALGVQAGPGHIRVTGSF